MKISIFCPMYDLDNEHMRHIFVECWFAKSCSECIGAGFDLSEAEVLSLWVMDKLECETEDRMVCLVKAQ